MMPGDGFKLGDRVEGFGFTLDVSVSGAPVESLDGLMAWLDEHEVPAERVRSFCDEVMVGIFYQQIQLDRMLGRLRRLEEMAATGRCVDALEGRGERCDILSG